MAKVSKARVFLYGASHCGFGFLAHLGERMSDDPQGMVDGMPEEKFDGPTKFKYGTATEALFAAHKELNERGLDDRKAQVAVHMDLARGPSVAVYKGSPPSFGQLSWGDGAVMVISAEAIEAAATKE